MIPQEIRISVQNWIQRDISPSAEIIKADPAGGGSINHTFCITAGSGKYFLKFNSAGLYPGMFEREAEGLEILRKTGCIQIPEALHHAVTESYSYLIISYIQSSLPSGDFWLTFGRQLAALHRNTDDLFGLDHHNYIGSLKQTNHRQAEWIEFFISQRLEPQLKSAVDSGLMNSSDVKRFNGLYGKLPGILPQEPPALIHGDLWSGNYMAGDQGQPCIFDPAVYYGYREMDIAMTRLFGGFPPAFYHAYQESFPMERGWEGRLVIHQLYPLLVHVNLFGSGYVSQVRQITGRF